MCSSHPEHTWFQVSRKTMLKRGIAALQWQMEPHPQRPSQWLLLHQLTHWLNCMAPSQPLQPWLQPSKVRHLQAFLLLHHVA